MKTLSFVFVIVLVVCGHSHVQAHDHSQSNAKTIREMTVTGQGLPFANSITGQDTIKRRQYKSIPQLLNVSPSLTFKNTAGQKSLFVRGASSNHTLVILDGVILNDPSQPKNAFDFNGIDLDTIESSELIVGPKASFYGNGGMGGVLLLTSKTPKSGDCQARFSLEGGTHGQNLQLLQGRWGGKIASVYGALRRSEDGLTQMANPNRGTINSDYLNSEMGTMVVGLHPHPDHRTRVFFQGYRQIDFVNGYNAMGLPVHQGDVLHAHGVKVAVSHAYQVTKDWKTMLSVTHFQNSRTSRNTSVHAFHGRRTGVDWGHKVMFGDQLTIDAGLNLYQDTDEFSNGNMSVPPRRATESGIRLKGTYDITDKTSLYISGRHDSHSRYQNISTWQFGLSQDLTDTVSLEINVGTGYKYPSLSTLYGSPPFQNPNPDAKPERSFQTEVSVGKSAFSGTLNMKGTFFYQDIRDVLSWSSVQRRVENLDAREICGLEIEAQGKLGEVIMWHAGYTYLDARDKTVGGTAKALGIANHKFVLGLDYLASKDLTFFCEAIHYSEKKDYSILGPQTLEPSTDIRFGFSYQLSEHVDIYGRVENGLNELSEQVYGYGRRGTSARLGLTVKT